MNNKPNNQNQNRIDNIASNQNNHINSNNPYQKNERYELAYKEFQYTNVMETGLLNGFKTESSRPITSTQQIRVS